MLLLLPSTFATKDELEYAKNDIRDLRESRAELKGVATQKSVTTLIILSVSAAAISLVEILVHILRASGH